MKIHRHNLYIRDEIATKSSGDTLFMHKLNLVVRRKFKIIRGMVFLNHFPKRIVVGSCREEKVNLRWVLTV